MQRAALTLSLAVLVGSALPSCYGPLPPPPPRSFGGGGYYSSGTNYLGGSGSYAPRPVSSSSYTARPAPSYGSSGGQQLRPRSFMEDMLLGARRFDIENAKKRAAMGSQEDADFVRREEPIQEGFERAYGPQSPPPSYYSR